MPSSPTEPNRARRLRATGAGWLRRALESDIFYSFRRSKMTMVAAAITLSVLPAGDLRLRARGPEPVRSGAASIDEFAHLAAVDRRRSKPVPARHRRTGPRRVFRHSLWPADFARGRRARRHLRRHARHHARADRGLCRWRGRWPDHAYRRRAAHLPGHPDRAARQRRRQIGVRQPDGRDEHAGGAGDCDRIEFLGAICPHRARLGPGREEQGLCRRRPIDRPCPHP